jgi:hypothetical protein
VCSSAAVSGSEAVCGSASGSVYVAVRTAVFSMWQCERQYAAVRQCARGSVLQCAAVCGSVRQCAAVCGSVRQCAALRVWHYYWCALIGAVGLSPIFLAYGYVLTDQYTRVIHTDYCELI